LISLRYCLKVGRLNLNHTPTRLTHIPLGRTKWGKEVYGRNFLAHLFRKGKA
jgi:hypothetical protein